MTELVFTHVVTFHLRPGKDPAWESRCIPGNLIGVGRTFESAVQSMADLIQWTSEDLAMPAWYADELARMTDVDRARFEKDTKL